MKQDRSTTIPIDQIIKDTFDSLTRAERQFADLLMSNYPVAGLGSITQLAEKAQVSAPTLVRLVQKWGFKGFPEFQERLRSELEEKTVGPIIKHDSWAQKAPDGHIINRYADAVMDNIQQTLGRMDTESFDASCKLLSNTDSHLYIVGGRITRALADYFFLHMQVVRKGVTHIQSISNCWPHYLLDIEEGSVVVIFDIRRYETGTLKLAESASKRGASIILFTDQWRSPVEKYASHIFSARIDVPSAWDSVIGLQLLVETFIASVQEYIWPETRARMEELEELFDSTRLFRKFN